MTDYDRWSKLEVSDDEEEDETQGEAPSAAVMQERHQAHIRRAAKSAAEEASKAIRGKLTLIASANDVNSERVRWALTKYARQFHEIDAPWGLWLKDTLPYSRDMPAAQDVSVPLLVNTTDKTEILRHPMDAQLYLMAKSFPVPGMFKIYPSAAIATLEKEIESRLIAIAQTIATASFVYNWTAADRCVVGEIKDPRTRTIYKTLWPFIACFLWFRYRLWDVAGLRRKLDDALAFLDHLERESIPPPSSSGYIGGETLSAADIALACGLAPLLCASKADLGTRLSINLASVDELPTHAMFPLRRETVFALRARPIGCFARRLYAKDRGDVSGLRVLSSRRAVQGQAPWWADDERLPRLAHACLAVFLSMSMLCFFTMSWTSLGMAALVAGVVAAGVAWRLAKSLSPDTRDMAKRLWFTVTKVPAPEPERRSAPPPTSTKEKPT